MKLTHYIVLLLVPGSYSKIITDSDGTVWAKGIGLGIGLLTFWKMVYLELFLVFLRQLWVSYHRYETNYNCFTKVEYSKMQYFNLYNYQISRS